MNKQSIKEWLIITAVFTGILLPLRFLFNHYLSHYWLGTFGITSVVFFLIYYYSKKQKLGKIGFIIIKRLNKRAKSKSIKIFMIGSIFLLYYFGLIIYGSIDADPKITANVMAYLNQKGITDINSLMSDASKEPFTANQWLYAFMVFIPSDLTFISMKIMNELSGGLILPLVTILFAEEIEFLGILLFIRYRVPKENMYKEKKQ